MLLNNKQTAVSAGRFWSDSQQELEPWDATTVRQLIRDNLAIPRVTKKMMLVYPDNWDDLVDQYQAHAVEHTYHPIQLPRNDDDFNDSCLLSPRTNKKAPIK